MGVAFVVIGLLLILLVPSKELYLGLALGCCYKER